MNLIFYYLFEKLHRYVFDYCFQCSNTDWGNHTAYKEANKGNKIRKHNDKIVKIYQFIHPCFFRFRYKLRLYFPNKYKRYEPTDFRNILKSQIDKNYNWFDKLVLRYRIYKINKQRLKKVKI
jgi:hypothetical protein